MEITKRYTDLKMAAIMCNAPFQRSNVPCHVVYETSAMAYTFVNNSRVKSFVYQITHRL